MYILSFSGLVRGEFVSRPNRFLALVRVNGEVRKAHVHDPGRLKELFRPGAPLLLLPKRGAKTDYQIIAAHRERCGWIFIHSGYHSIIAKKIIEFHALPEFEDVVAYGKEIQVDSHRIDFLISYPDRDVLAEVKGCTLFRNDFALFPDAPTKRGKAHLDILSKYGDSILVVLVMSDTPRYFAPNAETDPAFHTAFLHALSKGVHVVPLTFSFDGRVLRYTGRIPFTSDAYDRRLLDLGGTAAAAVKEYNGRFGPESTAVFSGVYSVDGIPYVRVVFHGVFCRSCGVYDYFEDYALVLEELGVRSAPENVRRFGSAFVVQYKVQAF